MDVGNSLLGIWDAAIAIISWTVALVAVGLLGVVAFFHFTQKRYPARVYARASDGKFYAKKGVVKRMLLDKKTGKYKWVLKLPLTKAISIIQPNDEFIEMVDNKEMMTFRKEGDDYIPVRPTFEQGITYKTMSYDMDLFRIMEGEKRKEKYKEKPNWMVALGPIMGIALTVVLIIVVGYLTMDYTAKINSDNNNAQIKLAEEHSKLGRYLAYLADDQGFTTSPFDEHIDNKPEG